VINQEEAKEQGYFWAVTEAKLVEGSAVVKGSNSYTPTLEVEQVKDNSEPTIPVTQTQEPSVDTHIIDRIRSTKFIS